MSSFGIEGFHLFVNPNTLKLWKWSLKTGDFVLFLTKQGGLWLGMTGGLSTQVKMYCKLLVH